MPSDIVQGEPMSIDIVRRKLKARDGKVTIHMKLLITNDEIEIRNTRNIGWTMPKSGR